MSKNSRRKGKELLMILTLVVLFLVAYAREIPKANVVGYSYDTIHKGNTVWELAERHCPDSVDIRDFVREIEDINGIDNSTVYEGVVYKIPVYKGK